MPQPLDPATRPSRLSLLAHVLTLLLLTASFCTGILVWRGEVIQLRDMITPSWMRPSLVIHGLLNPFLCGLFGYLVCQHIRLGWKLKANWASGLVLEITFLGLILTGLGLYYAGSENARNLWITTHRVLGLILPVSIVFHWFMAQRWIKNISK